jgi:putative tricarboxylic transport membrane protein
MAEPDRRRSANDPELYASAALLALAAAASVAAYRLGLGTVHNPGPGFMPFAAAALFGLLALGQLVRAALAPAAPADRTPAFAGSRWGLLALVLATLLATGFLFERIGFVLATFLMLVVLFGVVVGKRWWVALLSAALIVAVARLISGALGVPLPQGPLGL